MRFNRLIFIGTLILFIALLAAGLLGYLVPQFIRGLLPVNVFTFLITLFLIVAIALLIYGLFLLVRKQQSPPRPRDTDSDEPLELPVEAPFIRRRRVQRQPIQNSDDRELQYRLINMLAGDAAAAERLVAKIRQNHPGMPEDWYWQRAIKDVERDRL
ncbi:hypothetical protein [Allocoleopsis sp.]|uniref:hypothetical protein n=1 Tax=Allocoleopsis sp. TaxID=3088169 RepID=UPI002FD3684A